MVEVLLCLVVGVSDGDTLKARCNSQTLIIRVAEIDAPEKRQPFGEQSTEHLASLCLLNEALITPISRDRHGRTVARVVCQQQDASEAQLQQGMAWLYTRYSKDPTLIPIEEAAQKAGLGLWADPNPTPPWWWRKFRKKAKQ